MTMITPSYLGETIEYSSLHACRSTLEDPKMLASLAERQRVIVEAISIEGRSARDVGQRLGMSEGAVRVALHRALKALAAAYREPQP